VADFLPAPTRRPGRPHASGKGRVGYILKCFPRLSETFILNEVLELERQGLELCIYSMDVPREAVRQRLATHVRAPVEYLPGLRVSAVHRHARAHFELIWRHPLGYALAFLAVLAAFERDLLARFVQAGTLAGLLRRDGVCHLHAGFAHYPGSVAWIVHRITGLPYSLSAHAKDLVHSTPGLLHKKLLEAEVVFTCTKFNLPALESLAAPGRIRRLRRVYHGVDLERFPFECSEPAEPLILAVARLVEKKGLEHLISACRLLSERGRCFRCRIVAGSRDRWAALSAQIHALGLAERVVLEGPLDQDDVRQRYHHATVFALPAVVAEDGDRDGIPNVLVEAAATGVPIVSTPVGGIPELVRDGETGLVVPPRDAAALAAAIESLLDSPELRRRLRERARAHVEEFFDLRRNAALVGRELTALTGVRTAASADELRPMEQQSNS
jgi:glycosyltransferase involved in cell wall biosynthesis